MTSLQEASNAALHRDARLRALEFQGRWYTWGDICRVAERVRALLRESGAHPNAPVVFAPRNRPSAIAALIGLTADSRNIAMAYVYQSPTGIIDDIVKARPGVFIAAREDFCDELVKTLRKAGIAGIALDDTDARTIEGCERATTEAALGPEHPEIQVLTSGTTGKPKRFSFTYDLIGDHMVGTNTVIDPTIDPGTQTPMFLFFPLGNISGIYATLPVLLQGIRGVLVDRFNLPDWLDYIARYRPTWVGVPASAVQMILDADVPEEDLSCVRVLSPGAAGVDVNAQRELEQRYGIAVLQTYGATEFGGPVAMMTPELYAEWGDRKLGSVGRPYAGSRLRVVDAESGDVLQSGEEGLLEVWAPRIGNHWIRTSDLGIIDADGFIFHRGRADGAIVRGGFKLLPEVIERALLLHESVAAASIVGIPDARLGEVPVAAVQLRPSKGDTDVTELETHLREHVPATHIPARWKFVEALPVTPSVKTDRAAVRRLFKAHGQDTARTEAISASTGEKNGGR